MDVSWNGFSDFFFIITTEAIMFIVSDVITNTRFKKNELIVRVVLKNLKDEVWTLQAPVPQNGQTDSNNSSGECVNHFLKLALKGLTLSK